MELDEPRLFPPALKLQLWDLAAERQEAGGYPDHMVRSYSSSSRLGSPAGTAAIFAKCRAVQEFTNEAHPFGLSEPATRANKSLCCSERDDQNSFFIKIGIR